MAWLLVVYSVFLGTFFVCQAASSLYESFFSTIGQTLGGYLSQFLIVGFTVLLMLLRTLMSLVADKLDLEMGNKKFRPNRFLFCYAMDLFYFFFYRSLFMNVSK
jgi:hypothetical protein